MGQGDSKESGRMKYYKSLGMSAAAQADDGTLRVHTPRILQRYHQQEPRTHPEWESIPSIVVTDEFTHPREMTEMEAGGVTEEVSTNEPLAESAEKTWSPEQDLSDSDLEESIKEKMEIGQDNVETAHLIETITTSSVDTVDINEGSKQDKPDLIRRLSSKSRKRSSMKNKENAPKRGRLSKKKRHASKEDIWQECMDEYSIKFLRDSKKKKASSKNTPAPKKLDDSRYDDMHAMFAKTLPMPLKTTPLGYASVKDVDESREHNESSIQNWVTLRKVDKDHIASGSKQRGEELVKNIHVPLRRISDNMIQNKEIKEWRYSEPVQVDFRNVLRSTSPRSPSSPDSPHSKTEFFGEDKAFDTSVNHDTTILESSSASLPVEPYAIVDVQSNKSQEESGQSFMRPNRLDIGQEVYHDTTVHDLKMSTDPEVRARYIVDQGIETPTSREYIELTNQTYKESFSSDGYAKSKQQNRKDQNMFGSSLQKGVERSPSVEYMELEAQTVTDTTKGNKNLSHAREANMDTDYYTSHQSILTRDEVISRESKASNDQWNIRKGIPISTDKVTVVEEQRSSNTGILTNKFGTKADTELVKQTNHIQQEDLVPVLVSDKELSTNQLDKKESFKHIGKTSEMTVTKLSSASESESPEVSRKHPLGDTRDQLAISQRSVWQHNKENTQQADRVISPESQAATDISASLYHSSLVESEIDIPSGSTSPSTRTPSPTLEEHMRPSSDIQSSALGKYEDIVTPLASENNLVYDDAHQVFIEKQWDTAISSNHQTFPVSGQIRSSTGHTALEAVPEKVNVSNVSNSEKQQEYTEKEFQNYTIEDVSNSKVDSHAFLSSREMQSNIFPIVKVNNTGGHDESGHAFTKLKVNRDDSNWTMYNPNTSNTKRFGNVLTGTPSRYVSTQQSSRRYGTSPYFWKESGHQGASFSGDQHFVRSYTDGGVKVTKYRHSEHDEVKPGQIEELAKQHFQSNMKMFSEKLVPASPRIQENINVHKKVESVPEVQMESVDEVSMTAHGSVNLQAPSGNGPKLPKANVTTQEHFLPSVVVDESNIYMEVLPAEDNTASNSYKTSTYLRSGDQSEGKTDLQDEIITTRKIKVHSDSGSHARANPNILQDMSAVEETMSIDDRIDSYFKDIDTKSSHAIKSVKEAHDNPDGNQRQITKLKVIRHNEKSTGRPAGLERQQPAESVISKVTSWMKSRDRESESTVVQENHKPDINKRFREEIYIENEAPENFGIATQDTDNEGRSKPEIISKSTTEGIHMEKIVPEINQTSTEKMDIETQRKVDINRSTAEIHLEKGSPKAKERSEKDIESRARSDSSKAFREEGLMPNRVPEKQTLTKEIYIEKKTMPGYISDAKNRDFLAREGVAVSQEYDEVTIDRTITKELVDVENDMTDESETFESTSDIIGTIFDKIGGRKSKMNSAMDEVSGSEKKNTAIDGVPDEIHHSKKSDSDDSETLQTDRPLNKAQAPKEPKKAENIKMDKQDDKMAQKKKEEKDGKSPHWETPTVSAGDKNPKTNNSNSPNRKFHPETHLPRTHDSLNFSEAKGDFTVPVDNTKSHPSARQPVTRPRPHFKRAYVQGYQPRSFTNTTFETNVDPYEDKSYLSPYSKMLKAKIDEMKNATIHVDLSVDRTQGVGEMPTKVDPSVVRDQDITQDTSATATAYIGGEPRTVTVSMLEEVFFWKKKEPEKAEITTVSESVTTRNETAHINTMKEEMYVETTENKDDNVVPFGPGKKLEPLEAVTTLSEPNFSTEKNVSLQKVYNVELQKIPTEEVHEKPELPTRKEKNVTPVDLGTAQMQAKEPIQEIVMDDDIVAEKVKPRDFKIRWPEVDENDGEKQQVASSTIDMKEVLEKPVTGVKTNVNEIILQKPVEEEPVKAHAETSKPKRKLVSEGTSMTGGITSKEEISMTDPIPKEKPEEEQEVGAHIEDYEAEEETQEIVTNLENEFEEEEDQEATERFDDDFELESQRYTPIEKEPRSEVPTIVAGLTEEESEKSERDFPKMTFSMMSFDIKNSALTRSKDSTDPLRSSAGTPDTVRSATMDFRPESAASSTASSILSPGAESSRSFTFVIPPQDARNSPSGNGMTNVSLTIPNPQKDGPNNQYVAVKETTEEKVVQALDEHGNPLAPPQRSVETLRTLFQSPQEPNPNGATALNIDSTGSLTTVALPYLPVGNRNNQLEAPVKGDMQTHSMTFRPLSPNEQGVSGYTFEETVVREKQFSTKSIKDPSGPYPALPPASERPTSRGSTVPPKSPMSPLQKGSDSVDPVSPSSTMSSGPTQWRGRGEATSRSQTGSPRSVVQQESPEAFSPSSTMSSGTSLQKERGQPPVRRYQTGSPARGRDSPSRPYSPSENRLSQQQQSTKGRHMYQQSVSSRTISASSPSEYQVFVKGHGPGGRQSPPAKHNQSLNRFHKDPNQLRRQSNSASQSHSSNQTFSMQRHLRKGQVFHDQRGSMVAGATHEENVDSSLGRHPVRSGKGKWTSTPMGNI